MKIQNKIVSLAAACALGIGFSSGAQADLVPSVSLLNGFGGDAGYGTLAMSRNDDGSSNAIALPFTVNFFGQSYSSLFINNNGNVSFNSRLGTYTPAPFPIASQPMIAPYWADVDTSCTTCGAVYVAEGQTNAPNDTVVVTWNNVGYYPSTSTKTNNFQLVLRSRPDIGIGNFDIDFRYNRLEWTTGSASGGSGGLGGTPAQAGFDAGDGVNYFTLPGSRTAEVLDLATTSNVSSSTPGLWTFAVRNGALPDGSTPSNPLMPVVTDDGFEFDFQVVLNQQVFIDPPVAVGYDYIVDSGPNIASVLLPSVGDGLFEILYGDITAQATAGDEFLFPTGGVSRFSVRGIETSAGLDPSDPTAFVTGLRFAEAGTVSMRQIPVSVNIPDGTVPEPGVLALMAVAFAAAGITRRRKAQRNTVDV